MNNKIATSAGNTKTFVEYDEIRIPPQSVFTLNLCTKEVAGYTGHKQTDSKRALRKVRRQVQK